MRTKHGELIYKYYSLTLFQAAVTFLKCIEGSTFTGMFDGKGVSGGGAFVAGVSTSLCSFSNKKA